MGRGEPQLPQGLRSELHNVLWGPRTFPIQGQDKLQMMCGSYASGLDIGSLARVGREKAGDKMTFGQMYRARTVSAPINTWITGGKSPSETQTHTGLGKAFLDKLFLQQSMGWEAFSSRSD